ncbi:MAG: T9SS type A sorting domain-containing protein [Bacteroidia bacterium]|jgi:hypothetical protein
MRKSYILLALGISFLLSQQLRAQTALPYFSGFDTTSQQAGWMEYKKAATTFSHWSYASFGAYSAPNSVGHDYSPSTGITLTDNWFVSPGFAIANGGKLDSIRYKFSGFSNPVDGDTIGIYLLKGSQDPAAASAIELLFDFRGSEYQTDNTWRVKTNIALASTNGLCYFAIRYRNTDCSSKWLTVNFDNIAISGSGSTFTREWESSLNEVEIFPNPSGGVFMVKNSGNAAIQIQNAVGQKVLSMSALKDQGAIEIDLSNQPRGIYFMTISNGRETMTRKIALQ